MGDGIKWTILLNSKTLLETKNTPRKTVMLSFKQLFQFVSGIAVILIRYVIDFLQDRKILTSYVCADALTK